jgi:hypothetical protein
MLNLFQKPEARSVEEARIVRSNQLRELENHRGYCIELRADCIGTIDVIKRMRDEANQMEAQLVNRQRRLRNAEDKLQRMERALGVTA